MFLISWQPWPFDKMQALLRENPHLQTELTYTLRALTTQLNRSADEWGESRWDDYRLGFVGVLQVLVKVDEDDSHVEVVDLKLNRNAPPA